MPVSLFALKSYREKLGVADMIVNAFGALALAITHPAEEVIFAYEGLESERRILTGDIT